ncbi:M56 family metallopeptidase [Paenibacillus sp. J2TS4]
MSVGIHWYNPLVWLAVKKMKADREVACDGSAIRFTAKFRVPIGVPLFF